MNSFAFLFLFATIALVQGQNSTNQDEKPFLRACFSGPRTNAVIKNLMKAGKRSFIEIAPLCRSDMERGVADQGPDGEARFFNPTTVCNVGVHVKVNPSSKNVRVYTCGDDNGGVIACGHTESAKSLYLPWFEDKNTYMILDADRAHWFFTNSLSGCDMFIATHPNHPKKPLVVHGNLNRCPSDHATNFGSKGNVTRDILSTYAPTRGYVLRARVHKVRGETTTEETNYWTTYKAENPNVQIFTYNLESPPQLFYFFGQYQGVTRGWRFFLKGQVNAAITKVKWT